MKIKIFILIFFICTFFLPCFSQYVPTNEDLVVNDVPASTGSSPSLKSLSANYSFYNNFNNWVPYCENSYPLKNPPITNIEVTFHVFLDDNGQNNNYTNTEDGRNRLIQMLSTVNSIYSGAYEPSDIVEGVVPLPEGGTKIRFTLGDNNERIYFYNSTALNHDWWRETFYTYVNNNYPSRTNKLNVYFTAGHYVGKVASKNIVITNGGSGYTSAPTVTFNPAGAIGETVVESGQLVGINISQGGAYNGFNPPAITISGGGGSGATAKVTKLEGGATGYAIMPSSNLSQLQSVVMLHCYESHDWVYSFILAHELGHNLDLLHTFCGGGASAICCTGSCNSTCTSTCSSEYLSDVFGPCPGSTCPHITGWYDPTGGDPRHTNHMMGGSYSQVYISPMQAGQMHRAIALKSMGKYVKENTYSSIPLTINSSETWDFNLKLFRDIIINQGSVLTLANNFKMPYNGIITVENGAGLLISNSIQLTDKNKIIVKNGGTLKISTNAIFNANSSGCVEVLAGGYICIEQGANITLTDYNSSINLRPGYISGVNPALGITSNCVTAPASYTVTGNGHINAFDTDVYVQNETFTTNQYIAGRNIYIGTHVTDSKPQGPVIINNGAKVIFDSPNKIEIREEFRVESGSQYELRNR